MNQELAQPEFWSTRYGYFTWLRQIWRLGQVLDYRFMAYSKMVIVGTDENYQKQSCRAGKTFLNESRLKVIGVMVWEI